VSAIGVVIFLVIVLPVLGFVAWQLLAEARVRIDAGSLGLVIARGAATERVLQPGVHYVLPYLHRMVQRYPLRELTYLTVADDAVEPADFADPPLRVHLGDRTAASVLYTIRFRIRPDALKEIHNRVGPDGIKANVRDRSRQALLDTVIDPGVGYLDAFADRRAALQSRLATAVETALREDGFDVTMFTLRDVDLGEVGAMVQDAVRCRAELDREEAAAAVRRARVRNEAEANAELADGVADGVLRYRQIELWREIVEQWDGRTPLPVAAGAAAAPSPAAPTPELPRSEPAS
jgi:SPFH domain / Band 7 family